MGYKPVSKVHEDNLLHDREDEGANPGHPNVTVRVEHIVGDKYYGDDAHEPQEGLEAPEPVVENGRAGGAECHEQEKRLPNEQQVQQRGRTRRIHLWQKAVFTRSKEGYPPSRRPFHHLPRSWWGHRGGAVLDIVCILVHLRFASARGHHHHHHHRHCTRSSLLLRGTNTNIVPLRLI